MRALWILASLLAAPAVHAAAPSEALKEKARVAEHLLRDVEGVSVEALDGNLVFDGHAVTREDFDRVTQVVGKFPGSLNLVTFHKALAHDRAQRMEEAIQKDPGCAEVTVSLVNGTYYLYGVVDSEAHRDRAISLAETLLPERQPSEAVKQGALEDVAKRSAIRSYITVRRR